MDNDGAVGCIALVLCAVAASLIWPATAWVLTHYGVTDPVTRGLVIFGALFVGLVPVAQGLLYLSFAALVVLGVPLGYVADWWRRPGWRSMVDDD